MVITLGQARKVIAEFVGKSGKCPTSEDTRLAVLELVQRLLHQGSNGTQRKWCFCLSGGCFTAPPDMEVPIRVKIDGRPDKVWSKWYEFYDVHNADLTSRDYQSGLFEEVNRFFTIYDLPKSGARIAAVPLDTEGEDAHIIIQGLDQNGMDVFTSYEGRQIHGEKIPIIKDQPVFSRTHFTKITGVEKTRTCSHVRLYWQTIDANKTKILDRGLLSEYRPSDTHPSYRRFRVAQASCDYPQKVTVLGRVKMLDSYHDNDILPITNISALRSIAQQLQAERNDNVNAAQFHGRRVEKVIEDENEYYRSGQEPIDFIFELSPGSNENLQ